jgi:hypothetical protein
MSSDDSMTPIERMIDQGLLNEEVFALYTQHNAGEIDFGGIDKSRFTGEIQYVPVTDDGYWKVDVEESEFQDVSFEPKSAVIDSGKELFFILFLSLSLFFF